MQPMLNGHEWEQMPREPQLLIGARLLSLTPPPSPRHPIILPKSPPSNRSPQSCLFVCVCVCVSVEI